MPDRQLVPSGSPYEPRIGFSRAVREGRHVHVSGTAAVWPDGHVDPDPLVQARRCFDIALDALTACGGHPDHVIRTRMYLVDPADADAVGKAHHERFATTRPAATMIVIVALLDPRWKVEIELDALLPDHP